MNEYYANLICDWHYEGEYEVYNMPSFEEAKKLKYAIANPDKYSNFLCYGIDENLAGFIKLNLKDNNIIHVGIGLKPNLTGKGLGKKILSLGVDYIRKNYPNHKIMLEVRSWNQRAIGCYSGVGFEYVETVSQIDRMGNKADFVIMEYKK